MDSSFVFAKSVMRSNTEVLDNYMATLVKQGLEKFDSMTRSLSL